MSYQVIAAIVLTAWLAIGLALGIVMQRRGYSGFGWGVVGMVLGPIAVLVALFVHVPTRQDETIRLGLAGPGPVDVLVGVDGSTEALAAAVAAADTLGPRVGRFTLVAVVPLDATPEEEAAGRSGLDAARSAIAATLELAGIRPGAMVLHGLPADALQRHAADERYDLMVIGSHGRGASRALLGSAAASLLRTSPVPVLVAGPALARVSPALRRARAVSTI